MTWIPTDTVAPLAVGPVPHGDEMRVLDALPPGSLVEVDGAPWFASADPFGDAAWVNVHGDTAVPYELARYGRVVVRYIPEEDQ